MTNCTCHPIIKTMRDVQQRNDDHAADYYAQFTDEAIAEMTAGIDLHA